MYVQSPSNMLAVLITFHGDPPYIYSRRRYVFMPQRILRLDDAACLFRDYPRERVTRLVNMNLLDARGARVPLQVL
jgi:hypothetical protein